MPGRALRPGEEPELATLVRRIAEAFDLGEPVLVRVVPTPHAAVVLKEVSGVRTAVILLGWPLLRVLNAAAVAAVVAHELAHQQYVGSWPGHILLSARESLADSLESRIHLPAALIGRLLRATQSRFWGAEFAADAESARVVGAAAVRTALQETDAPMVAFDVLVERWLEVLYEDGEYPVDLYDALESVLQDSYVVRQLARIAATEDDVDPYGVSSHPPTERRIEVLPEHPGVVQWDNAGPVPLRHGKDIEQWCIKELTGAAGELRPGRILTSPAERFDGSAEEPARALTEATGRDSLPEAVTRAIEAIGDGTWPHLAVAIAPETRSNPAAARVVLIECLGRVISAGLLDAGWSRASRWTQSVVVAPDGAVVDVYEAIEAALDSGDLASLRTLQQVAA